MPLDVDIVALLAWTLLMAAAAAAYDLRTGLIPNRLVIATLTIGVVLNVTLALVRGLDQLPVAALRVLFGAIVCGLIPLALYVLRSLGGGDLKLLVAIGACLGPSLGFETQVYAFASASLYAFGRAAYEGSLFRTLADSAAVVTQPLLPRAFQKPLPATAMRELRFAPAIFVGVLLATISHVVAP